VLQGEELRLEAGAAQLFGRPARRRSRVVELVGEASRELAEGRELLLLAVGALRKAHALGQV
jgi:hypothetical protein